MTQVSCYAAHAADAPLKPHQITRRATGATDVQIDIEFCGVCHTDIHYAKNDWGRSNYPIVPGHEIVGTVRSIGPDVKDLRLGQRVAVGCFVGSCQHCSSCHADMEQYCLNGFTATYNTPSKDPDRPRLAGSRGRCTFALRGHHHLLATETLERQTRHDGRCDWPRRTRPHGD